MRRKRTRSSEGRGGMVNKGRGLVSVLKSDQKSSVMGDLCITNQWDFITLYTTTCTIFNTTTNHTIEANAGVFGII